MLKPHTTPAVRTRNTRIGQFLSSILRSAIHPKLYKIVVSIYISAEKNTKSQTLHRKHIWYDRLRRVLFISQPAAAATARRGPKSMHLRHCEMSFVVGHSIAPMPTLTCFVIGFRKDRMLRLICGSSNFVFYLFDHVYLGLFFFFKNIRLT